jgi:hypothetical protein
MIIFNCLDTSEEDDPEEDIACGSEMIGGVGSPRA